MKKMGVTWVDKNESFFKRTHNKLRVDASQPAPSLVPSHYGCFRAEFCRSVKTHRRKNDKIINETVTTVQVSVDV